MGGDVLPFSGDSRLDTNPDRVLQQAVGCLSSVVICGVAADGSLFLASSHANPAETLLRLQRAARFIVEMDDA